MGSGSFTNVYRATAASFIMVEREKKFLLNTEPLLPGWLVSHYRRQKFSLLIPCISEISIQT